MTRPAGNAPGAVCRLEGARAPWATALYAGLRRGEIKALRWGDVDFEAGLIRVERGWDPREGRHTYAAFMIAAGVNAKALSSYMGHSSITMTLDRYGHLMPGNEDEAADLLGSYLERECVASPSGS